MATPIDQQTLSSISNMSVKPTDIFNSYMKGKAYKADKEDREFKRAYQRQQMELMDTNLEIKRLGTVGSAAVGVLDMISRASSPAVALEQYRTYRENAPDGIRDSLPQDFGSIDEATNWARQTAAQADKLAPWMQLKARKTNIQQWQYKVQLAAIPESERTDAQQRQLEAMMPKGININMGTPSKSKIRDTVASLGTQKIPDTDQSLLDSMDDTSRDAYISHVSNMADMVVAESAKTKNPIDRSTAMSISVEALKSRVVEVDSLVQKIPYIGELFDKDYAFITDDKLQEAKDLAEAKGSEPDPKDDNVVARETIEINGWLYDKETKESLGRAK